MPMTTSGLAEQIAKFRAADARLKAALDPVVAAAVHKIGTQAEENAAFSSLIPAQEFEHSSFLSGEVGFTDVGFPHRGKVRVFEGDGTAPEPFMAQVYGGPGEHEMLTHPFLGPAVKAERSEFNAEVRAAVHEALS